MKIPLSAPDIGELEITYVTEVLRSGHLSLGPKLAQFEERFAEYAGTQYAIAANSGTSALHMCIRALEIGAADEVITTSFSFVASTNCFLYEGTMPRFVDIDPRTLNIDPRGIRKFLERKCARTTKGAVVDQETGRTVKAILPVHVFGFPCDMKAIGEIATEYGLFLLEDACEGIGAERDGRRVGSFGDAGVFAFYPNKQITTGEGGLVVTNDARIADACRSLRNQGRDSDAAWLKHVRLGYNYRLSDVAAALGVAQLERIDEILAAREEVARHYSERLSGRPEIVLPPEEYGTRRSWFVYAVQLQERSLRERARAHLSSQGIASQVYFPAIHHQPYFQELCPDLIPQLPHTERAADTCLALPFCSRLTTAEIDAVCDELISVLDEWNSADRPHQATSPSVLHRVEARF